MQVRVIDCKSLTQLTHNLSFSLSSLTAEKQNLEKIDDEEELGDEDPDVDYHAHEGDEHEEEESEPSALMGWFS